MERIALISDLHGNVTAFEAVLKDIDARGISTIHNLGDVAGKGPRGSECIRLTRERCAVTVRGNWDDFLPNVENTQGGEAMWWWRNELTPSDRQWLADLPYAHDFNLSGRWIRLFHASAESVYTRVHFHHSQDDFDQMFSNTELTGYAHDPSVVCYGDIHDSYLEVNNGRTLINAGSVGNALDEPMASYVILEGTPDGEASDPFGIQFVRVPYDIEAEIAAAEKLRMPELAAYATELRTGIYRGRHEELGLLRV
ncbi:protein phosphatase [Arthrobacter pigmenti]|uniref:Protein phosphatase n=1 Tax=Arthrobacter pigmenti TaxID=271432 RepID=A0A846RTG1_9MICC|nr:protein phosphatase [Arthrobacter pigmenti]